MTYEEEVHTILVSVFPEIDYVSRVQEVRKRIVALSPYAHETVTIEQNERLKDFVISIVRPHHAIPESRADQWILKKAEELAQLVKSRDQQIALAAQSKGWIDGSTFELEQLINNAAYAGRKTIDVDVVAKRLADVKQAQNKEK
jgi:hypothetical protein